ncbi:MAG TPA: hypothetical protein ENJ42_04230 [Hellea balneolensis]|uniref:ATP synthase protein I n=1 Tax=Hellea balneolensis TaxID=287478 RepID=A0A7C5R0I3_9PROT|nr:hypothetical protein [Hellea balneolensis]
MMGIPSAESIVMVRKVKSTSKSGKNDALEALGEKVRAAQAARTPEIEQERTGWAVGIRYASEFTAAVVVGGLFGFGIDYFAKTAPWFFMVGLILGFSAGTRNIVRTAKELNGEETPQNSGLDDTSSKKM